MKKTSNPTKTVLTISVGFAILFLVTQIKYFIYFSTFIAIAGLVSDTLSMYIDKFWMQLTKVLSYIVPNIILSILFFIILTPIAKLALLFGEKDPLNRRNSKESLFDDIDTELTKESLKKTW